MDAAATPPRKPIPSDLLLAHCQVLESKAGPPARVRLEAMLGRDLTRRLVQALTRNKTL